LFSVTKWWKIYKNSHKSHCYIFGVFCRSRYQNQLEVIVISIQNYDSNLKFGFNSNLNSSFIGIQIEFVLKFKVNVNSKSIRSQLKLKVNVLVNSKSIQCLVQSSI
jgi:hypothetical protein